MDDGGERESHFYSSPFICISLAIRIVIHRLRSVMMGMQLKQLQVDF
jgi:hypothetical protein